MCIRNRVLHNRIFTHLHESTHKQCKENQHTIQNEKNKRGKYIWRHITRLITCSLKSLHSSGVIVSALAITGMMLTLSPSRCINSTSRGLRPCPLGAMKYRQQCTRVSGGAALRVTRDSAFKNSSYFDSTKSIIGCQLKWRLHWNAKFKKKSFYSQKPAPLNIFSNK